MSLKVASEMTHIGRYIYKGNSPAHRNSNNTNSNFGIYIQYL